MKKTSPNAEKSPAADAKGRPARVRMIDIARMAGVSRPAVSAVLSGSGEGKIGVSPKTAAKIRRIADRLQYHPNHAARQLAGKRSALVGILGTDWDQVMQFRILAWLGQMAEARGFHLLAWQTKSDKEVLQRNVQDYLGRGVEGLVFLAFENDPFWPTAAEVLNGVPNVVSVMDDAGIPGSSCVRSDVGDGVRQAVAHLHAQGRRRIVQVLENVDSRMNRRRRQAFDDAHRELGRSLSDDMLCVAAPGWNDEDIPKYDALAEELVQRRGADAILATDDHVAAALMRFLQARGVRVPDDVAVVGWGNDTMAHWLAPPLTSVSYRLRDIMGAAVDLLAETVERPDAECRQVEITPLLYVRGSS